MHVCCVSVQRGGGRVCKGGRKGQKKRRREGGERGERASEGKRDRATLGARVHERATRTPCVRSMLRSSSGPVRPCAAAAAAAATVTAAAAAAAAASASAATVAESERS